jgi:type I restriction enzyme S subunit
MNNEQVPAGYKNTEVGVIPEDWEVKSLGDLSEKITVGIASAATHAYRPRGIPLIRNQNIKSNILNDKDILYISEEYELKFKNKRLREGDLLTARTGYPGTTCIVPKKLDLAQSFTTLITRPNRDKINSKYLSFFINSNVGQSFFEQNQIGGGQKNVNAGTLRNLLVPIPTREEQKAIAQVLSDTDTLISALDKLIAKKRNIKTATMQQLLTGQKRLPGFGEGKGYKNTEVGLIPEDWEVAFFKDIGESFIGLTYKPDDIRTHGTLVLRSSNIQNDQLSYEDNVYISSDLSLPSRVIVREEDILICVRNGSRQLIGKCALIDSKTVGSAFGAFMSIFRTKISRFTFYQFQSDTIKKQINEIMGATINQITNKDMLSFKIPLPPSEKEQKAIAQTLSDMDAEITALETRLTKTKAIKQGMMQELLTGKVRLK